MSEQTDIYLDIGLYAFLEMQDFRSRPVKEIREEAVRRLKAEGASILENEGYVGFFFPNDIKRMAGYYQYAKRMAKVVEEETSRHV